MTLQLLPLCLFDLGFKQSYLASETRERVRNIVTVIKLVYLAQVSCIVFELGKPRVFYLSFQAVKDTTLHGRNVVDNEKGENAKSQDF